MNNKLKILFVGHSSSIMYSLAFYNAAKEMSDVDAAYFDTTKYLNMINLDIMRRAEDKLSFGPTISKMNKELLQLAKDKQFDIVFVYSSRFITAKALKKIKQLGSYVAVYSNDNPFSKWYPSYYWRNWIGSVKHADICYVYRDSDLKNARSNGAKEAAVLRSYYIKERNYFIPDEEIDLNVPDVVFIGHYEDDERADYIKSLTEEGISVGINDDGYWKNFELDNNKIVRFSSNYDVYNKILNKAKIAIVFLSKINNDTYTRRCYEIPVVKTLMLAPYTDDIASMYKEDEEAVFYHDKSDFISKIKYYLLNEDKREQVALAGYMRLKKDGNEVSDRVRQVIDDYHRVKQSENNN